MIRGPLSVEPPTGFGVNHNNEFPALLSEAKHEVVEHDPVNIMMRVG